MSQPLIRSALETRLKALMDAQTPGIEVAWDNTPFIPDASKPYVKSTIIPANTENPSVGADHQRRYGVYQVSICYPENGGPNAAETLAEVIVNGFPRGLQLTNSITVQIDNTPSITLPLISQGWYMIPVQIRYRAEIIN